MMRTAVRRLAVATCVVALATACAGGAGQTGGSETLTMGIPADVSNWDPAIGAGGNSMAYLEAVYSSLTALDHDFSIKPKLATEWSYDAAKTTLSMTLTPGITFSDGAALDAAAVKANLDRGRTGKGPTATALATVTDVKVADPTHIVLTLSKPDPGLLYQLSQVPGMIASPAGFAKLTTTPVGSGPYLLDEAATTRGASYTFTRSPSYKLPTKFGFDKFVIKALPDVNAMLNATTSGQVDLGGVTAAAADSAKAAGLETRNLPGLTLGLWMVDRAGKLVPQLADVRVRQAINHGIDAKAVLGAIGQGHGTRTTQVFAAGTPAYVESLDSRYPYDPAKAKQLLTEAGLPNGFTLPLPSENAYLPSLYPILAQQLAKIGIKVEYTPVSTNQITQQFLTGKFAAFMYTYSPTQNWQDATTILAASAPFNPFKVDDPTVSSLMQRISVAEEAEQAKLFKELNTYIVEQAWFAPLYTTVNLMAFNPKKVNIDVAPNQPITFLTDYKPVGAP